MLVVERVCSQGVIKRLSRKGQKMADSNSRDQIIGGLTDDFSLETNRLGRVFEKTLTNDFSTGNDVLDAIRNTVDNALQRGLSRLDVFNESMTA